MLFSGISLLYLGSLSVPVDWKYQCLLLQFFMQFHFKLDPKQQAAMAVARQQQEEQEGE